jgi:hypothetical protein
MEHINYDDARIEGGIEAFDDVVTPDTTPGIPMGKSPEVPRVELPPGTIDDEEPLYDLGGEA